MAMIIYFAICIFAFYFILTFENIKFNQILIQNISLNKTLELKNNKLNKKQISRSFNLKTNI
jgi:hypothetical protein